MSAVWMDIIMRGTLSGSARNLAMAIADGANQDGECVMRLTTIRAYAGGVSKTTAKRVMRQMEADGVISIERDKCGRVEVIQLHPMDPAKMDPAKMDPAKMDPAKMDPAKEVVIIGKSQEESGLQDSDGDGAGEKDGERGAKSDAKEPDGEVCPSPRTPLSITNNTILESITGKGESAERGEGADARTPAFAFVESEADDTPGPRGRKNLRDCPSMRPTEAAVIEFVRDELGLEESDAVFLYANWQENGWRRSEKAPVRDWKACCRTWKAGRYFPSQKVSTGRGGVVRGYRKIDYSKGF